MPDKQIESVVDESVFMEIDKLNYGLEKAAKLVKNETLLRLECLRLAGNIDKIGTHVITTANRYFDFVIKGTVPEHG